MSAPAPLQLILLAPIHDQVHRLVADSRGSLSKIDVLEAVAAEFGGFSAAWYADKSPWPSHASQVPIRAARQIQESVAELPMHHAVALAGLSTQDLNGTDQKQGGIFYTDHRLTEHLTAKLRRSGPGRTLADLACGSGTLLAASVIKMSRTSLDTDRILERDVFGFDTDPQALRAAAMALASLTSRRRAIASLWRHLIVVDSLRVPAAFWRNLAPAGFDVVIGNPPWERLRLSRHEHAIQRGAERVYGHAHDERDLLGLNQARSRLRKGVAELKTDFDLQDDGEADLYKLFLELALRVVAPNGEIIQLVPAGLIRSLGSRALRQTFFDRSRRLTMTVFDNKDRFFEIDTRFKFLSLRAQMASESHAAAPMLELTSAMGPTRRPSRPVRVPLRELARLRRDLTVPEVRSDDEWACFRALSMAGSQFDADGGWDVTFHREVDMTNDRPIFRSRATRGLPVIEGRMVHQYRHDWKRYVSGTGRGALWRTQSRDKACEVAAQFHCAPEDLSHELRQRVSEPRFGFCDVTGQTNERTMLAAAIPAGVVCGNKVPTLSFHARNQYDAYSLGYLWLAVANSLTFDWLVRRLTTTSLNYFVVRAVPIPSLNSLTLASSKLATIALDLSRCEHSGGSRRPDDDWAYAEQRAEIEWRVLAAYKQRPARLTLILDDFPLLDRAQPPLGGERKSTVTRDLVLLRAYEALGASTWGELSRLRDRVHRARELGAVPFVPPGTTIGLRPGYGNGATP